jgi:dTDP-4-dehydrorhamnose reductase
MRILVTGAGGMLGHDLVRAATSTGVECVALTHGELDVTDAARAHTVVSAAKPDVLLNCAAWTDVDGAESAVDAAVAANGEGAGNVARAASRAGAWTIQVSTDYVFDGAKRTPYLESDATRPLSAYGTSKLAGESAVAREAPESYTIVRSSWLFGAHGHCFPATILRLAREREELTVVDDQVGRPTFTGHLAGALLTLCETRPLGIVHVAGEGSCSWFELAGEVVAAADLSARVNPGTTAEQGRPASRPPYSVLGTERPDEAPALPHWREGLAAYMTATGATQRATPPALTSSRALTSPHTNRAPG